MRHPTPTPGPQTGPDPLAALAELARSRPFEQALRVQRTGRWGAVGWAQLHAWVEAARAAWRAEGVGPQRPLLTVGPLGVAWVVSALAARTLGAELQALDLESPDQPELPDGPVLLDGAHELEAWLALGLADARRLVIAHPVASDARDVTARAQDFDTLLAPFLGPTQANAASARPHRRVNAYRPAQALFAEFAPGWQAGAEHLLSHWLATGQTLVLPEPLGDVHADRRSAGARHWLASPQALAAWHAMVLQRIPGHSWIGRAVLAFLDAKAASHSAASPWRRALRWRLAAVLGLPAGLQLVTDDQAPASALGALRALGVRVGSSTPARAAAADPLAGLSASTPRPSELPYHWAGSRG